MVCFVYVCSHHASDFPLMCVEGVNRGGCNMEAYKSVSGCNRPAIGFQNKSVGHKAKEEAKCFVCVCVCVSSDTKRGFQNTDIFTFSLRNSTAACICAFMSVCVAGRLIYGRPDLL